MATDYKVKPRSDDEIRAIAKRQRRFFGIERQSLVDIRRCLMRSRVLTVFGEKQLFYRVNPDCDIDVDGRTIFEPGSVTIEVKKTVDNDAQFGSGRERQTLAHELGHAILHEGPPMSRQTGAVGNAVGKYLRPFESAEHQAKVFAPAFLINDGVARLLSTPEEISAEFCISTESARIYFDQMNEPTRRRETFERIDKMVGDLRAELAPKQHVQVYYTAPCNSCGQTKLIPIGNKFLCDSCGVVSDQFQDGDPST